MTRMLVARVMRAATAPQPMGHTHATHEPLATGSLHPRHTALRGPVAFDPNLSSPFALSSYCVLCSRPFPGPMRRKLVAGTLPPPMRTHYTTHNPHFSSITFSIHHPPQCDWPELASLPALTADKLGDLGPSDVNDAMVGARGGAARGPDSNPARTAVLVPPCPPVSLDVIVHALSSRVPHAVRVGVHFNAAAVAAAPDLLSRWTCNHTATSSHILSQACPLISSCL